MNWHKDRSTIDHRVQMRAVGASVFLPKPPSARELATAAARLLGAGTE
jgi:DNA-binding response OmpR family regulator